jgi:hypothetical protein
MPNAHIPRLAKISDETISSPLYHLTMPVTAVMKLIAPKVKNNKYENHILFSKLPDHQVYKELTKYQQAT